MAGDAEYTTHLAARVLNDNAMMTYRLLSRELKVHVNRAKEMLYAFHQNANSKKPGSCHATYLIAGYQPWPTEDSNGADAPKDEEDTVMMSSPFEASQATQVDENMADKLGKMTIMVVAEEQLEAMKESFVQITSIHVYSIEAAKLKDLVVLSAASKEVVAKYADDAPEYRAKTYGTTFNQHAKKRPGRKLPTQAPNIHSSQYVVPVSKMDTVTHPPAPKKEVKETPVDKKDFFAGAKKKDAAKKDVDAESSKIKEEVKKEPTSTAKTATAPKKGGQSNIMSSFGKAQPKKPKPEPAKEDTMDLDKPMFSEDEDDGDDGDEQEEEVMAAPSGRKTRKQREEELKKMMEEEEEEEAEEKPKKTSQKHKRRSIESEESIKKEEEEEEATDSKDAASADEAAIGTASASESGPPRKRRGKRQVKKRITTKDEQGFLVTKHEMVWESFSEDETEPPAATAPKSSMPSSSSSKLGSQKGGAKKGGGGVKSGNIMSFFGKK